jgi:tetratricopeptide (TPR) repeat protein
MNKKLLSSFILSTVSLTSVLANENYSNEHFQKAIESYQNRLFQDSYILLQQYTKENKLSSDTTFILARSAYEIGKFSEALNLYKSMLKENPNNNRVKLELAKTSYIQQTVLDLTYLKKHLLLQIYQDICLITV